MKKENQIKSRAVIYKSTLTSKSTHHIDLSNSLSYIKLKPIPIITQR